MSKNKLAILLLSLTFTFCFAATAKAIYKSNQYPSIQNEKFAIRALLTLHGAQVTYQATTGNGNYGSLKDLRQAYLIDEVTAAGDKYGYRFTVFKTDYTATTPAKFYVTATPRLYRKSGRRSFYTDESGEMHGADKNGAAATTADPVIDTCFSTNEGCSISNVRWLHSAQITYQATIGNGNYGTFNQLYAAGLISQRLANGSLYGYLFAYTIVDRTNNTAASFKISAVPANYGISGIRSFYMAADGVLRGADKNGAPADENDLPIGE